MAITTLGDNLTFENLGCGAAAEKFEESLQKVLADILDPNTVATASREISLKVSFKPSEERTSADVMITCDEKLAKDKAFPTKIFIGRDVQGNPEAHEINAQQMNLFPSAKGNVTAMQAAGKEE